MFRYQFLIEYLGTNYKGWQIQKKNKTIQGILQDKIRKLLKEKITLVGSGRTDAGVHAIEQSAHFDIKNKLLNLHKFINSINHFLKNENIAVLKIKFFLSSIAFLISSEFSLIAIYPLFPSSFETFFKVIKINLL